MTPDLRVPTKDELSESLRKEIDAQREWIVALEGLLRRAVDDTSASMRLEIYEFLKGER